VPGRPWPEPVVLPQLRHPRLIRGGTERIRLTDVPGRKTILPFTQRVFLRPWHLWLGIATMTAVSGDNLL
jgi:hypothetical protein